MQKSRSFLVIGVMLASINLACATTDTTTNTENTQTSSAQTTLADLHDYIEAGRQQWGIPGMAVAVVHNDEIIHLQGYGVLKQGESTPVDGDTLFGVASTSKAMTAATLAMLVDEGKLDWDDRVIDHLPWFQLQDPWVTREVRVRDLLTHQVGVGRMTGNRLQFMPTADRETVIRQMRYHEPEAPFRSRYVYSNVMYSVAGEVAAAVSGMSWDELMATRLFAPLNMTRSNTSITQFGSDDKNIAWPHQWIDGELVPIARRNFDNVGPSASVNTSVRDMAQWIRLQLGEAGAYKGVQLLSPEVMAEMHTPQVTTGRSDRESAIRGYGLGWSLDEYRGLRLSQHGGATDGFNTSLVMVPELDLGIVVVTNTFTTYRVAVVNEIIDRVAGFEPRDWNSEVYDQYQDRYQQVSEERAKIHAARELNTQPSVAIENLVGRYYDPQYQHATVFMNDQGGLSLEFWDDGVSILDLEHWHHDTWRASWRNRAQREKFVYFTRDDKGEVASLNVRFTLRPALLQVGIYPTSYYRDVSFKRVQDKP
ncbi:serine hydrolase [Aliidiomarina indica]|uniref:serine hydrolase n=1 Tax=Aliidiomarina indica TaxID=2749147 RepID=UPI00188FF4BE|nr:serine hydrolase [Aliidiomarina indica]